MKISELLQTETDRVEWKRSAEDSEGLFHAACALANDLGAAGSPGFLLMGVDKDGSVCGVDRSRLDEIQRKIADRLRSTKLQPTPTFTVAIEDGLGPSADRAVVRVTLDPYPVPPVVAVDGVAWVRQGSTTRRATEADWQRLRERRPERHQPFDLRPMLDASLEHLDTRRLREAYDATKLSVSDEELFPSLEAWLTQCQLGRSIGGVWRPNPAAVLLYGVSPQSLLPAAKIEFVRYKSMDVDGEVASRKTITGTLGDQLDAAWAQFRAHIESVPAPPEASGGMREPYQPQYPLEALKELARNLVQHRLYEGTHAPARIEWFPDRIEISNPGGPFGRASEGALGDHTDCRNPVITARLVDLGYVEQLGRGIRRVRLQLERSGNPPLEVEVDGFTRVIVRARS